MRIILASGSPRRKELLRYIVNDFEIKPSNAEENATGTPAEVVKKLSLLKAKSVFELEEDKNGLVVIGSDTIVVYDGEILGKPKDHDDAKRMLSMLSKKVHKVYTGIAIVGKGISEAEYISTEVLFDELSEDEIEEYIATGDPMDKAGSYGIQSCGGKFIKSIEGDWSAVMGLPLNATYRLLKKYNAI